jgi:phosphate starvation-inducible protein PhoH
MTKAKTRRAARRDTAASLHLDLINVRPLTDNQAKVLNAQGRNQELHGCAGTGKTFLSSYLAFQAVLAKKFGRLVYIRSAVATRDIGFLPGTESEKVAVYELPYKEIANELFDRGGTYDDLKKKGVVDFLTTSHVRGTTLNDSVVIVDEIQNMTFHELDSVITRYGKDCQYYFCGDFRQADLKQNGIKGFLEILRTMGDDFEFTEFTEEDIVRSDLVKRYIIARNAYESSTQQ